MKRYITIITFCFGIIAACSSCKKFLDAKSDASLSTPSTLDDLQALLDGGEMNKGMDVINLATDEYYLYSSYWNNRSEHDIIKDAYVWNSETNINNGYWFNWNAVYKAILYTNTVLDNIVKIEANGNQSKWNNIKGSALFCRARYFYELAQTFAVPYSSATANSDLGIPLRLTSDYNKPTTRSTLQETYDQIIKDVQESISLLPITPLNKVRPGKPAAYALLARTYLTMEDYAKAKVYADSCLLLYNTLLDYNLQPITSNAPFQRFNDEVIFHAITDAVNGYSSGRQDTILYSSYVANDLRKTAYFRLNTDGSRRYKGSYNGDSYLFTGIATDEIYLIRAESYARLNNVNAAMQDLNTLLIKRWATGSFVHYTATTADEALTLIIQERKKELLNRGLRWFDLRRLNRDSRFAVTLKRVLNSQTYTLPPNDPRYTWLIPVEVINLTGIQQNSR